jgi:hypothetical protein
MSEILGVCSPGRRALRAAALDQMAQGGEPGIAAFHLPSIIPGLKFSV